MATAVLPEETDADDASIETAEATNDELKEADDAADENEANDQDKGTE